MKIRTGLKFLIPLGIILIIISVSCTSNWPQFRGPENKMVINNKNLPEKWGIDKNLKWSCDLSGIGWSSPIVWGDKVFVTSAFAEKNVSGSGQGIWQMRPPQPQQNQANQPKPGQVAPPPPPPPPPADDKSYMNDIFRWELTCYDIKSGKELWRQVARTGSPRQKTHAGSTYANETPATDGKRIIAYFGMTGLYCYDMNGKMVWQKDLGAFFTLNGWGTGSSPVLYNDRVYVQVDNEEKSFIIALDAKTGNELWKAEREEKTCYSTPVIWKNKIRTELVTTGKTARSYDLLTGKIIWQLKLGGDMAIPSPVFDTEHIYIGNAGGRESKSTLFSVKAGAEGDITPADSSATNNYIAWSDLNSGLANPSPVLDNGFLYIIGGRGGEVRCLDAVTGKLIYKEKIEGTGQVWASPWINNDKLYFYDEKGVTQVIKTGSKFEVADQNKLEDKFWSSVAIASDAYIFKGAKKVFCIAK
jgi:outer membrane protein assembly factor BamB